MNRKGNNDTPHNKNVVRFDLVHCNCDGPAQKPTLAVDLWVYWLPLRMVHGKTKEKKNKTKHKQNKTTSATNKQSRHNKNT